MAWSWGVYVLSILFGFLTLMASAGVQQAAKDVEGVPEIDRTDKQRSLAQPTINASNIRLMGSAQLLTFLVAIILTVIAGAMAT